MSRDRQAGRRSVSSRDWRAWLSPPYSFRAEHCATRDQITEISGGDCFIRWQFFPATLKGYTVDLGSRGGDLTVAADMPLPLVISELVDGRFLWTVPEGARREPELELVGTSELLGRKVLRLHLEVKDWSTRFVGWSETVLVADNYELLLDRQSGIILRIGCWIDRAEYAKAEVLSLGFNEEMNRTLFAPPFKRGTTSGQ